MRNLDIISREIVEISAIKSAYNHYLASHRSLTEVENTTNIQQNKLKITKTLRALYKEKSLLKAVIASKLSDTKPVTINYSEDERNAILHFNNDRRFSITE